MSDATHAAAEEPRRGLDTADERWPAPDVDPNGGKEEERTSDAQQEPTDPPVGKGIGRRPNDPPGEREAQHRRA